MQNTKCKIQNSISKIQNAKYKIKNAKYKLRKAKFKGMHSCIRIEQNKTTTLIEGEGEQRSPDWTEELYVTNTDFTEYSSLRMGKAAIPGLGGGVVPPEANITQRTHASFTCSEVIYNFD